MEFLELIVDLDITIEQFELMIHDLHDLHPGIQGGSIESIALWQSSILLWNR